ncbi:MAG: hypothetical protein ACOYON_07005 [Fimbriimonas sp.]
MVFLVAASLMVQAQPADSRAFRMGFTRWPSDLTVEAMADCQKFAEQNGDIVSVMFIGGIPWQEALEGKPYSQDVRNNFAYRVPQGKQLFLSISPLAEDRTSLAPYWGDKDNLPLPAAWAGRGFDSPEVLAAYKRFVIDATKALNPDYLGIAIEANVLLSKDKARWEKFKPFYRQVYAEVKKQWPKLPVFFTTDIGHYLKMANEAKAVDQEGEVADLMKSSDLFAMSWYPFMNYTGPARYQASQTAFATKFGKPIAVTESGMTSRDIPLPTYKVTIPGSDQAQVDFANGLLEQAQKDRYRFVINFATTDFDRLVAKLPESAREVAGLWQNTGVRASDGKPKPVMAVWRRWFARGLADR